MSEPPVATTTTPQAHGATLHEAIDTVSSYVPLRVGCAATIGTSSSS
jgi:hypothetical protein